MLIAGTSRWRYLPGTHADATGSPSNKTLTLSNQGVSFFDRVGRSQGGAMGHEESTDQTDATFVRLMRVIEDRRANPPERSYTTRLFSGGVTKIGEKILEEAREVVEAAGEEGQAGRAHLVYEAADLIYHLFVMLGYREIALDEVQAELARRFGISGLDEKESRSNG
jgi:phosphoribosyl-ATP pyrophosphohydrolase